MPFWGKSCANRCAWRGSNWEGLESMLAGYIDSTVGNGCATQFGDILRRVRFISALAQRVWPNPSSRRRLRYSWTLRVGLRRTNSREESRYKPIAKINQRRVTVRLCHIAQRPFRLSPFLWLHRIQVSCARQCPLRGRPVSS